MPRRKRNKKRRRISVQAPAPETAAVEAVTGKPATATKVPEASKVAEAIPDIKAPASLRRLLRFGNLGLAGASGRSRLDIFNLLVTELRDMGVPEEAVALIEAQGPSFLSKSRVKTSIIKAAGGATNANVIKDTMRMARAASIMKSPAGQVKEFDELLKLMGDVAGEDLPSKEVLRELKGVGAKRMSTIGMGTAVSVLESRGSDPGVVQVYKKIAQKAPTPTIAASITEAVAEASGGTLPGVTAGARKSLTQAGVKGVSKGVSLLRTASRAFGGSALGLGINAAILGVATIPGAVSRLGRGDRSVAQAKEGFAQLGASSNIEFLKEQVEKQEALSRRRIVMQKYEPEMFSQVIRILAQGQETSSSLTVSESRIGSPVGDQFKGRKSVKNVQFLLDQLLSQAGNV